MVFGEINLPYIRRGSDDARNWHRTCSVSAIAHWCCMFEGNVQGGLGEGLLKGTRQAASSREQSRSHFPPRAQEKHQLKNKNHRKARQAAGAL